jgi:hypothetical protein
VRVRLEGRRGSPIGALLLAIGLALVMAWILSDPFSAGEGVHGPLDGLAVLLYSAIAVVVGLPLFLGLLVAVLVRFATLRAENVLVGGGQVVVEREGREALVYPLAGAAPPRVVEGRAGRFVELAPHGALGVGMGLSRGAADFLVEVIERERRASPSRGDAGLLQGEA